METTTPFNRLDQFLVHNLAHLFAYPTLWDALEYLHSQGAHYVLLTDLDSKKPIWAAYQHPDNRPTLEQVRAHLGRGGALGLIPWSLKLAALDVDGGSPDAVREFRLAHHCLHSNPSWTPGRQHIWYEAWYQWGQMNGLELAEYGIKADVRCGNAGFVVLYDPIGLAHSLSVGRRRRRSKGWVDFPADVVLAAHRERKEQGITANPPPPLRPSRRQALRAGRKAARHSASAAGLQLPVTDTGGAPPHFYRTSALRQQTLLDTLRDYFKSKSRERERENSWKVWQNRILYTALVWNQAFPTPLKESRARSAAHSAARFLWALPQAPGYLTDTRRATQQGRQAKGVQVRRERHRLDARDSRIRDLFEEGKTHAAIGAAMGISRQRVGQILASGQVEEAGKFTNRPPPVSNIAKEEENDGIRHTKPAPRRNDIRNSFGGTAQAAGGIRRAFRPIPADAGGGETPCPYQDRTGGGHEWVGGIIPRSPPVHYQACRYCSAFRVLGGRDSPG